MRRRRGTRGRKRRTSTGKSKNRRLNRYRQARGGIRL